jgi:Flp pilus assembly CpaF family ATPase
MSEEDLPEPQPIIPGVAPESPSLPETPQIPNPAPPTPPPASETPEMPSMPAPEMPSASEIPSVPDAPADDPVIADAPPLSIPESARPSGSGWASAEDAASLRPPDVRVANESEYSPGAQATIKMIQDGLDDPECTQIDGYGPARFSAQLKGTNMLLEGASFSSEEEYVKWLRSLIEKSGSIVTWDRIEEDRMGVLELRDGSRLSVFLPPIARFFPTFSLRKHTAAKWQTSELIKRNSLDERMLLFLQACVAAHVNILFVGAMGSGKSTLMRSLLQGIGDNERVAIVEQVPELGIRKPLSMDYLYQPTVEGYGLGDVLDFNLYNGLDRLVVGEVHLDGITKMLETMILTEGSMSTYHAYSTEQAGERMKLAVQLENSNVSAQTAVSFIRQAIEIVVVLQKLETGRKITQITEIDWRTSMGKENLAGGDLFIYDRKEDRFVAKNAPHLGRIEAKLEKYQVPTRHDWFIEADDLKRFKRRVGD